MPRQINEAAATRREMTRGASSEPANDSSTHACRTRIKSPPGLLILNLKNLAESIDLARFFVIFPSLLIRILE
jgi:hypothetical protein